MRSVLSRMPGWEALWYLGALYLLGRLLHYYLTGIGGALKLAVELVPLVYALAILKLLMEGGFYRRLSPWANNLLGGVYLGIVAFSYFYFNREYQSLFLLRSGAFTSLDYVVAALFLGVVLEVARRMHPILVVINLVFALYAVLGPWVPWDPLWHPGISWKRLLSVTTLELQLGMFGDYAQLGLTLIGAFLLLAALGAGFDLQPSLVRTLLAFLKRARHLPQLTVLASMFTGMITGSAAANSAVVGSVTIPLMQRVGIRGQYAAAIEAAASTGGLIMPPLMAAAAFLMAQFMGVSYGEVLLRGFVVALPYYATIALSVYLISLREVRGLLDKDKTLPRPQIDDFLKVGLLFLAVTYLLYLLVVQGANPLLAALQAAGLGMVGFLFWGLLRRFSFSELLSRFREALKTYTDLLTQIVVLMTLLSIFVSLSTATGFILRMGQALTATAQGGPIALVFVAWLLGLLLGLGLPPTATYVILAVIIVDPLRQAGFSAWQAHFFSFLLGVYGDLTPPVALSVAVASAIAGSNFLRTNLEAVRISLPLLLFPFVVLIRPELLDAPWTSPGFWLAFFSALVAFLSFAVAFYARSSLLLRFLVAGLAGGILLAPISAALPLALVAFLLGGYQVWKSNLYLQFRREKEG